MKYSIEEYNIGHDILGAAFEVRKNVGRGLLEKFYEAALAYELRNKGHKVNCQVLIPALYCGEIVSDAYRADIVVDNKVIIEIKAISNLHDIESCQLFTYLKLSGYKLGYLINFGAVDFELGNLLNEDPPYLKGIYSMVNNL